MVTPGNVSASPRSLLARLFGNPAGLDSRTVFYGEYQVAEGFVTQYKHPAACQGNGGPEDLLTYFYTSDLLTLIP
jgi:hypothetical protein